MVYLAGIGTGILGGFFLGMVLTLWVFRGNERILVSSVEKITSAVAFPGKTGETVQVVHSSEDLYQDGSQVDENVPDWMTDEFDGSKG